MSNERTTDQLSNEVKSKVKVIHQYLKHIEQLEAEKAELVDALVVANEHVDWKLYPVTVSRNIDLIQKHAKK